MLLILFSLFCLGIEQMVYQTKKCAKSDAFIKIYMTKGSLADTLTDKMSYRTARVSCHCHNSMLCHICFGENVYLCGPNPKSNGRIPNCLPPCFSRRLC
jgi:hypothetical protein